MALGFHIIAEFYGCDPKKLERVQDVEPVLRKAAEFAKFNVLDSSFHQFEPHGVTGILLLSESHVSIHTWPEHGYAALDIFTCSTKEQAKLAYSVLKEEFKPQRVDVVEVDRGVLATQYSVLMSRE